MALRFVEGFDHYGTFVIDRKWTYYSGGGIIFGSPVRTLPGAYGLFNGTSVISKSLDSRASWIIGFGFQTHSIASDSTILSILDLDGVVQLTLDVLSTGKLEVTRDGTTVLATESGTSIVINEWTYIEMKFTIDDSAGIVEVHVTDDAGVETTAINISSQDTQNSSNATSDTFRFSSIASHFHYYDDIYICDTSGSKNNDFLGNCEVTMALPDGVGNSSDWQPQSNNYQNVDDGSQDVDDYSSYVEGLVNGDRDDYAFPDVTVRGEIFGVAINAQVAEQGVGNISSLEHFCRVGGVNYDTGVSDVIEEDWTNIQQIFENNPDDAAAWEEADVNGATFGMKLNNTVL